MGRIFFGFVSFLLLVDWDTMKREIDLLLVVGRESVTPPHLVFYDFSQSPERNRRHYPPPLFKL